MKLWQKNWKLSMHFHKKHSRKNNGKKNVVIRNNKMYIIIWIFGDVFFFHIQFLWSTMVVGVLCLFFTTFSLKTLHHNSKGKTHNIFREYDGRFVYFSKAPFNIYWYNWVVEPECIIKNEIDIFLGEE